MNAGDVAIAPPLPRARPTVAWICGALLLGLIAIASLAPWLAPHDPFAQDLLASLRPPSSSHWLGTDEQGRDTLSRLLYALRVDFFAAFVSVGIGLVLGVPLGALLGYGPRWADWAGMRLVDAALAIPPIVLILAVVAVLGRGLTHAMIALGLLFALPFLRLVRGQVLALRESLYAKAARATGLGRLAIIVRHLLPGALPALVVQIGQALPVAFLVEASLSYLGLSVQPPEASLGSMLQAAQAAALTAPWQVLPAGVVLAAVALLLNLTSDGIGDALNPRPSAAALLNSAAAPLPSRRPVSAAPPLQVSDLTLSVHLDALPSALAVRGVSFTVEAAEIVAIVGESGSGKTLCAMSILGLLPAAVQIGGGSIRIGGAEVVGATPAALRGFRAHEVGVIFQEPLACLDPGKTVGAQLIGPLRRHQGLGLRAARQRVLALLREVGVTDAEQRLGQYPHELSGGVAQRVMIALALSREPRLLIADEPTSALDVSVQLQVLDLLLRLRAGRGLAILLITHNMGVVRYVADRVLVMYAGEVVEAGSAALLAAPRHPYTAALSAAVPRNAAKRQPLPIVPGRVPQPGQHPGGCGFAPRCRRATTACWSPVPLHDDGSRLLRCRHPLSS